LSGAENNSKNIRKDINKTEKPYLNAIGTLFNVAKFYMTIA